ncbi:MAG: DNA repair protein RecO [Planctomycetota bacterium]|jgi:DNA repair protein RecO (recombination protein O)
MAKGLTTTTALCIRKIDFSETSQILTLITEKLGTVGVIAKGAKRKKSATNGPLDLMCLYNVVLYDRSKNGSLGILAQAELLEFFPQVRDDYLRYYAAQQIREILLAVHVAPEDGTAVLLATVRAMRELQAGLMPEIVTSRFAWMLLGQFGVRPVVDQCVVSGMQPSGKVAVSFSATEMGLISPPHNEGRTDLFVLRPDTLMVLQALSRGEVPGEPDVDAWRGAFTLLAWLAATLGGRRLKTVSRPRTGVPV